MAGTKIKFSPKFLALVDETARKIFGNLPIVPHRTGNKYLRMKPIGPILNNYYPTQTVLRSMRDYLPGFLTDEEERRQDALARLKRRGKGPPPKGKGKRSSRKK